jgi:hypothetical protein
MGHTAEGFLRPDARFYFAGRGGKTSHSTLGQVSMPNGDAALRVRRKRIEFVPALINKELIAAPLTDRTHQRDLLATENLVRRSVTHERGKAKAANDHHPRGIVPAGLDDRDVSAR